MGVLALIVVLSVMNGFQEESASACWALHRNWKSLQMWQLNDGKRY